MQSDDAASYAAGCDTARIGRVNKKIAGIKFIWYSKFMKKSVIILCRL